MDKNLPKYRHFLSMDTPPSPNLPEQPPRRHTIDVHPELTVPRYDLVLPSYSRDRRVSSTTTTIPLETIMNDGSTNVGITVPDQNSSSIETANNRKGINNEMCSMY